MKISTAAMNLTLLSRTNQIEGFRMRMTSSPSRRMWRVSSVASDVTAGTSAVAAAAAPSLANAHGSGAVRPSLRTGVAREGFGRVGRVASVMVARRLAPSDHVLLQDYDIGQVAVVVVVVQPISDHEFIGNLKAHVIHRRLPRGGAVLAQEHAGLHRFGAKFLHERHDELQSPAAVEDVVDEQHMPPADVAELLTEHARALRADAAAGVAADRH